MLTVATICARGGSVGIPAKNIMPLKGKPLICYTIEHALACQKIDRVFVSTDLKEIAEVARGAEVEVQPDGNTRLVKPLANAVVARQEAPVVNSMNTFIYCWHRYSLDKGLWEGHTRLHVMSRERPVEIERRVDAGMRLL